MFPNPYWFRSGNLARFTLSQVKTTLFCQQGSTMKNMQSLPRMCRRPKSAPSMACMASRALSLSSYVTNPKLQLLLVSSSFVQMIMIYILFTLNHFNLHNVSESFECSFKTVNRDILQVANVYFRRMKVCIDVTSSIFIGLRWAISKRKQVIIREKIPAEIAYVTRSSAMSVRWIMAGTSMAGSSTVSPSPIFFFLWVWRIIGRAMVTPVTRWRWRPRSVRVSTMMMLILVFLVAFWRKLLSTSLNSAKLV